jgi:hypothetical protein
MEKKNVLSKILAIAGTVLVWLPIVAPVFFGLVSLIANGQFRFDYLMPAEFFPIAILGGGLIFWAAVRERTHVKRIAWTYGIMIGALIACMILPVVTGIDDAAFEPTGWRFAIVLAALVLYTLAVIATGVCGIILCRGIFKRRRA